MVYNNRSNEEVQGYVWIEDLVKSIYGVAAKTDGSVSD